MSYSRKIVLAILGLGLCHSVNARDSYPAIKSLPTGIDDTPKDPMFLYNMLIQRHPEDYVALYRRGKLKEDQSRTGALRDFRQSLHMNPLQTDHYTKKTDITERTMRAWAFQDLGFIYCSQGKFEDGIECLSHAIALRPAYADNFQNRGAAYRKLGKLDLAKKDFQKANILRRTQPTDECLAAPMSISKLNPDDLRRRKSKAGSNLPD